MAEIGEQKMMACVLIQIDPEYLPDEGMIWLFEIDAEYSLDAVQKRFVEANRHIFGEHARATCEIGRVKSYKKLIAWADRKKRNRHGLPPLTGWCGPLRLAPQEK